MLLLITPGLARSSEPSSIGTFLLVFRCEPEVSRALFSDEHHDRIESLSPELFHFHGLRARLAKLSGRAPSDFRFAASIASFGGSAPTAFATASGQGFLVRTKPRGERMEIGFCATRAGELRHLATRTLSAADILVLELELDGQPCVAAIRCEAMDSAMLHLRQRQFRQGTAGESLATLSLTRLDVPAGRDRCLEGR